MFLRLISENSSRIFFDYPSLIELPGITVLGGGLLQPPKKGLLLRVYFPVSRGKWRKVPKGGRPPPRRKVDLSVAKRRMKSHILKHDASSTANAVPLLLREKALK